MFLNRKYYNVLLLVLWDVLNVLLFVQAGMRTSGKSICHIYPFNYVYSESCLWGYDITELLFYIFVFPALAIYGVKYVQAKIKTTGNKKKFKLCVNGGIIYCYGFIIISFLDNSSMIGLYLSCMKAILIIMAAYYVSRTVFSIIIRD